MADRRLVLPWKRNLESGLWKMTWYAHHHVLSFKYLCFLTGPQPNDSFGKGEQNNCKFVLCLTTNCVFENFGGGNFPISPWLQSCLITKNRLGLRTDCSEKLFYHVKQVSQWISCTVGGPRTCACQLIGLHVWKGWERRVYSFQGSKQKVKWWRHTYFTDVNFYVCWYFV